MTNTDRSFALPTNGYINYISTTVLNPYAWIINWGDGSTEQTATGTGSSGSTVSASILHTYTTAGQYQITIRPSGVPASGWFNAFGFYNKDYNNGNYKFRSIDTPFTNMMRTQDTPHRFSHMFRYTNNMIGIPTQLFANISVLGDTDLSNMFYSTFENSVSISTDAILPAGLFDFIDNTTATKLASMFNSTFKNAFLKNTTFTIPAELFGSANLVVGNGANVNTMLMSTFYSVAPRSTIGTIPSGLFDFLDTSGANTMESMFQQTFFEYAYDSTAGTIPVGLFDGIHTTNATDLDGVFIMTFRNYAVNNINATVPPDLFGSISITSGNTNQTIQLATYAFNYYATKRQADFIVNGTIVNTQNFTRAGGFYVYKIGLNGPPTSDYNNISAGSKIYPTYSNTTTSTIAAPGGAYTSYFWYTTDGTSCLVANPTADCGAQNDGTRMTFPTTYWDSSTPTDVGSITLYGTPLAPPTVTAVNPNQGFITEITGEVIAITGTNFNSVSAVTVGGSACASYAVVSSTQVNCTLPAFATVGEKDVLVTNPGGTSPVDAAAKFRVLEEYVSVSSGSNVPISVSPGKFSSSKSIITVSTNNPNGYTLSMRSASANLTHVTVPAATIPSLVGYTAATPASSLAISTLIGASSFWAYRVNGLGAFGATTLQETNTVTTAYSWATIPTIDTTVKTGTVTDDLTTDVPQTTDVWYGMGSTGMTASGDYQVVVTYTAVGN